MYNVLNKSASSNSMHKDLVDLTQDLISTQTELQSRYLE